jgi:hypothetical protein
VWEAGDVGDDLQLPSILTEKKTKHRPTSDKSMMMDISVIDVMITISVWDHAPSKAPAKPCRSRPGGMHPWDEAGQSGPIEQPGLAFL